MLLEHLDHLQRDTSADMDGTGSAAPEGWAAERDALEAELADLRAGLERQSQIIDILRQRGMLTGFASSPAASPPRAGSVVPLTPEIGNEVAVLQQHLEVRGRGSFVRLNVCLFVLFGFVLFCFGFFFFPPCLKLVAGCRKRGWFIRGWFHSWGSYPWLPAGRRSSRPWRTRRWTWRCSAARFMPRRRLRKQTFATSSRPSRQSSRKSRYEPSESCDNSRDAPVSYLPFGDCRVILPPHTNPLPPCSCLPFREILTRHAQRQPERRRSSKSWPRHGKAPPLWSSGSPGPSRGFHARRMRRCR